MAQIRTHKDLWVFHISYRAALDIFKLTKTFPREEIYSLTDQIRRSSRSVPANIAEAWRKRRYPKSFIAKLSDSETEAAETQVWLDFSLDFKYISPEIHKDLYDKYDYILSMITNMQKHPEKWTIL
ncbi:MAG: four helix bundle protein [Bacteroidetes bacterium]|nr:MAG: four helix bundle protein [Bacteroidota bacterium]